MVPVSTECVVITDLPLWSAEGGGRSPDPSEKHWDIGQVCVGRDGSCQRGQAGDDGERDGGGVQSKCRTQSSHGGTEGCLDSAMEGPRDLTRMGGLGETPPWRPEVEAFTPKHVTGTLEWGASQVACESDSFSVISTEEGHLRVRMTEQCGAAVAEFVVKMDCVFGRCLCVYSLCEMPCQLKPCQFFAELFYRGGIDPDFMFILKGIVFGFNVIDSDFERTYDSCRKPGKLDWENTIIEDKLLAEIESGVISVVDEPPMCIHGVFVVPKDGGGGRSVVDCSKPYGESVNSATATVASTFKYRGVDEVIEGLRCTDYLASIDIKDAYRAVHIHPRDRRKQGLKWKFKGCANYTYMADNRLCMGLASSPFIFSRISDFIVRCASREGIPDVTNYLDDFCVVGRSKEETGDYQVRLMGILRRMGFYISFKKLLSPTTKIRFLGIDIDAQKLELTLPEDKLIKLQDVLGRFEGRRRATRRELERLGGLLAHCAKVVRGGRTFSRRVYDIIAQLRKPYYSARLNVGFKEDVGWWRKFVGRFNGKAGIVRASTPTRAVYSDSSGWGFGATHGVDWLVGTFNEGEGTALGEYVGHHHAPPPRLLGKEHINIKEMWAVLVGAARWATFWRDASIIFVTDSAVVCAALNTGRSRSPKIMEYVRRLFWLAVEHNFVFTSTYINTKINVTCDALSRFDRLASNARIRGVDGVKAMCCAGVFECPPFSLYRAGGAEAGAARV